MKHKKEKNRLLAFLLCIVLLFSNLSTNSFVTDAIAESAEHEHEFLTLADDGEEVVSDTLSNDVVTSITSKPVIEAISETGHSRDFAAMTAYCEPPQVVVTDADNDLLSVTIQNGSKPETTYSCDNKSKFTHQLEETGAVGYVVTITAEDDAGNKEVMQILVSHTLGGRDYEKYDATCAEPAKTISSYLCAVCGETYNVQSSYDTGSVTLEHKYDTSVTNDLSKCGGSGTVTTEKCLDCGYVKVTYSDDYTLGDKHTYIKEVAKNPTCLQGVYAYEQCSVCGVVNGEQTLIKSTGHDFSYWKTTQEADCSTGQQKIEERHCQNDDCDVSEIIKTNASHKWVSGVVLQEPTCTEVGYKGSKCLVCGAWGETKTEIPALGHVYSDDNDCTTQSECSRCNNIVPGIEHNLGDFKSDGTKHWRECQNSGCSYREEKEHVRPSDAVDCTNSWRCEVCNYLVARSYTSHSWGEWQSDENYHWQVCTHPDCTQTTAKTAHSADDGNCLTEHKCSTCQKVITEAKTGHNYSDTYSYTVGNHYRVCTNSGCKQTSAREEHTYTEDYDCTTSVKCDKCGYVVSYGEKSHKFTNSPYYADENGAGHYQLCQNRDCNVRSGIVAHSGGTASCKDLAICEICRSSYGSLDSTNHEGGTEKRNIRAATETEEGYTGDEVCLGCGAVVKKGEIISKLEPNHDHNFVQQKDDTGSWEQCECGEIRNKLPHTFIGWNNDSESHWQVCVTCGYETTHSSHVINENEVDKNCATAIHCKDCGIVMIAAQEHSFSSEFVSDDNNHWHVCTNQDCEQTSEKVIHNPVDNGDCTSTVVCEDCGRTLVAAMSGHNWSSVWDSDADGHYKSCLNDGCKQTERENHSAVDDGICTTPILCAVCGYEIEAGAAVHDFAGSYITTSTGHYQKCQNPGCNEYSAETPHSGGTATCKSQAVCQVCATAYGDKDSNNHTGNKKLVGYVEPTAESEGYTGDYVCVDCGETLEAGTILDKVPEEHEHIFDVEDYVPDYYLSDDVNHWYECSCGAIGGVEAHTFGNTWESDNTQHWRFCMVCGKVVIEVHSYDENGECECGAKMTQHEHNYVWMYDTESHWKECIGCGETTDHALHTFENDTCSVCGAKTETHTHIGGIATCKDLAVCDICGESYGELNQKNHAGGTEIRGYVEPTTEKDGYSGDEVCTGCGTVLTAGIVLDKLPETHKHVYDQHKSDDTYHWDECICGTRDESSYAEHKFGYYQYDGTTHWHICDVCERTVVENHRGGAATCKELAVCTICGESYGQTSPSVHVGETEVRNKVEATYTQEGYTGDTYCLDCGALLATGSVISKIAHNHSGGTATCVDLAVCDVCGEAYGEVDFSNHVGNTTVRDQKDPTSTEKGYTGDTYCLSCGELVDKGTDIPAITETPTPEPEIQKSMYTDDRSGVFAEYTEEGSEYADNIILVADELEATDANSEDAIRAIESEVGEFQDYKVYDISLKNLANGELVQPDGQIRISIPLPDGWLPIVYHVSEDGTVVDMKAELSSDGKYVSFITDHLSLYVLVNAENAGEIEEPAPTETQKPAPTDSPDNVGGGNAPTTGDNMPLGIYLLLMFLSGSILVILPMYRRKCLYR